MPPPDRSLRILIVEDVEDDAILVVRQLKRAGFTFQWDRVDTLQALRGAISQPWDAILIDYNLPGFEAPEALETIRAQRRNVPCIIISGTVGEEVAVETIKLGANNYVLKDRLSRLAMVLEREVAEAGARQEQQRLSEELAEAKRHLNQVERVEAIAALAGGIAHEFNNALQVITGFTRMSLEAQLPEDVREDLTEVLDAAEHVGELTGQLLSYGRRTQMTVSAVSINRVISRLNRVIRPLLEASIDIECTLSPDPVYVSADEKVLHRALMNLVINARDAMPEGGTLRIEAERAGDEVAVHISDTGTGIPEDLRERIFDPFFTTKPIGRGTGLGLPMVQGMVIQHGGTIDVRSDDDGTQITLRFPAIVPDSNEDEATPPSPARGCGGTILVVEDEQRVRQFARRLLERAGFTVYGAANGLEALEVFDTRRSEIDLVLTDVVMPRMGGIEVAFELRKRRRTLPIVFSSGYPDRQIPDELEEPNAILAKPYSAERLVHVVNELLASR